MDALQIAESNVSKVVLDRRPTWFRVNGRAYMTAMASQPVL